MSRRKKAKARKSRPIEHKPAGEGQSSEEQRAVEERPSEEGVSEERVSEERRSSDSPERVETPEAPEAEAATVSLERYQRLLADFDNYRKRMEREQARLRQWGAGELLSRMLPILDDCDRARSSLEPDQDAFAKEGILIIMDRLAEALRREGLAEVEASQGVVFDPGIHEAVLTVPSDELSEGHVAEVLQKGYRHGERLLRPAKVAVVCCPVEESAGEETG